MDLLHRLSLQPLPPSQSCQAFLVLAAAGVLTVAVLPPRPRHLLLRYGPRSSDSGRTLQPAESDWLDGIVSSVTAWGQVPHWWFTTFYATSMLCSAFWAYQYIADGNIIRHIASAQYNSAPAARSQRLLSVYVAWALMALQGARRFYEQLFVFKKSNSTMWFLHWLLGLAFYVAVSIAVWIEGSASILEKRSASALAEAPSAKLQLGVLAFLVCSIAQYNCHVHLASLKKYSLPTQGLFRVLVCAHYTCECLLYLSLALVAAPDSQFLNRAVLSAFIFVVINLGVTAHTTRKWYESKFGAASIASRWTMIPLVY